MKKTFFEFFLKEFTYPAIEIFDFYPLIQKSSLPFSLFFLLILMTQSIQCSESSLKSTTQFLQGLIFVSTRILKFLPLSFLNVLYRDIMLPNHHYILILFKPYVSKSNNLIFQPITSISNIKKGDLNESPHPISAFKSHQLL